MAAVKDKPTLGDAAMNCNVSAVQNAISNGANPNELDIFGSTPLLKAVSKGSTNIGSNSCVDVVNALLNAGADVNTVANGQTALIRAAKQGHSEVVQTLIKRGADINATDEKGKMALDYAKELENNVVVKILSDAVGGGPAVGGGRRKTRNRRNSRRHRRRISKRSRRR